MIKLWYLKRPGATCGLAAASTVAYRLHASSHMSRLVMHLDCVALLLFEDFPAIVKCSDNKSDKSTNSPRFIAPCTLCGRGAVDDQRRFCDGVICESAWSGNAWCGSACVGLAGLGLSSELKISLRYSDDGVSVVGVEE